MEFAVAALHDFTLDLHVVAFQEVGHVRDTSQASGITLCDFDGYTCLVAKPPGCFRHVAIGLDSDCLADWSNAHVGHSHLCCCVRTMPFVKPVCFVSIHLPHKGRPLDDFLAALSSLEACLRPFACRRYPIVVLGDLNVDLCCGAGGRLTALLACFHGLGLVHYSSDSAPTWRALRLDHIVCNAVVLQHCLALRGPAADDSCPWAFVEVRSDLRHALSVDHCFVFHELLLRGASSAHRRACRASAFLKRPCKMRVTNSGLLQHHIYGFLDLTSREGFVEPLGFLTECAQSCTSRVPALRFRDSPTLQHLCRARSVCSDPARRRDLSFSIHLRRKWEKHAWRKHLVDRAARGDWLARRALQRRSAPSSASAAQGLVRQFGLRDRAVTHVREHFAARFAAPPEPPLSFDGLCVSEPDFTPQEVGGAVARMKVGTTTGMSQVSVELLRCLVALPLGLVALTVMLNSILHSPETANIQLASGWVILLPKTLWPQDAKGFRPIVCGEVLAKLAARLATNRVVQRWAVPPCCFGSVSGKGLPDALYVAKHAAQASAGFADGAVFVQLDLTQAFDSLFVNAILAFFQERWNPATGLSACLLRWLLLHSRLRFQLFDFVWWCAQGRGTQQGGSHSPTLFARIVAARFQDLSSAWTVRGERPPFVAGLLCLWGLWFIDDSLLLFQTRAQAVRLLPEVIALLATMGLTINVSKSCVFGSSLSIVPLPGCLAPFRVVQSSTYLGMPLRLDEDDELMVDRLCCRATSAFFSNRMLFTNRCATRGHKVRLFGLLVTASIRWSLCVLSVKQRSLHRLRVHCVTLLTWVLGGRAHKPWFAVECLQALRHGVALWGRTYVELWDSLLARMVWQWVGHVLRQPADSLTRAVLLDLRSSTRTRRCRTGPNNDGHRNVLRYLHHCQLPIDTAANRQEWKSWEPLWLCHNGVPVHPAPANVFVLSHDRHLWSRKCLQGSYHGQQVVVCEVSHPEQHCCLELDRLLGWRKRTILGGSLSQLLRGIHDTGWLLPHTFHLRLLIFQADSQLGQVHQLLSEAPLLFQPFHLQQIVAEISKLPFAWSSMMKQLVADMPG